MKLRELIQYLSILDGDPVIALTIDPIIGVSEDYPIEKITFEITSNLVHLIAYNDK